MPGSVASAAPTTVLPLSLNKSFVRSLSYPVIENEYKNGESQRGAQTATSRRSWQLSKVLTSTELGTLKDFYTARKGPLQPFYFYDPWSDHDPTGVSTTGRYIVRFNSPWTQSLGLGRLSTNLELIEIA